MCGGGDATPRVDPTPLDSVLALLCGGGGNSPSHTCFSIETHQADSLSGWRSPLPQVTASWTFNFGKYPKNNREKPRPRPAYSPISGPVLAGLFFEGN